MASTSGSQRSRCPASIFAAPFRTTSTVRSPRHTPCPAVVRLMSPAFYLFKGFGQQRPSEQRRPASHQLLTSLPLSSATKLQSNFAALLPAELRQRSRWPEHSRLPQHAQQRCQHQQRRGLVQDDAVGLHRWTVTRDAAFVQYDRSGPGSGSGSEQHVGPLVALSFGPSILYRHGVIFRSFFLACCTPRLPL